MQMERDRHASKKEPINLLLPSSGNLSEAEFNRVIATLRSANIVPTKLSGSWEPCVILEIGARRLRGSQEIESYARHTDAQSMESNP